MCDEPEGLYCGSLCNFDFQVHGVCMKSLSYFIGSQWNTREPINKNKIRLHHSSCDGCFILALTAIILATSDSNSGT